MSLRARILIVAQDELMRTLLHSYFTPKEQFEVVGEGTLDDAEGLCRKHRAHVLLAFHRLAASALGFADHLQSSGLSQGLVVLLPSACNAQELHARGVAGCAAMSDLPEEFDNVVLTVAAGGEASTRKCTRSQTVMQLTMRQQEVLTLIIEGASTKEVASRLHISFKTADHHRSRLMKKLSVHTLTELIKVALQSGLAEYG